MLSRLRSHVRHNVVGYIAVFIALSGTAYAAKPLITGADVFDGSLTGVDIENDSVKGVDLDESSLGKVGDADTLDGLDASDFTPAEAVQSVRVAVDDPVGGDFVPVLTDLVAAGPFTVKARCEEDSGSFVEDATIRVAGPDGTSFSGLRESQSPQFIGSPSGSDVVLMDTFDIGNAIKAGHLIAAAPNGQVMSVSGSAEVNDSTGDCVFAAVTIGP